MIPQGTPAYSCSAFWHNSAFSTGGRLAPVIVSSSVAVATSSDALLESPPPTGTLDSTTA